MNRACRLLPLLCVGALALALGACTPPYPKCKEDAHCKDRPSPKTDKLLWCVNGSCVVCRDSSDCGEGQECKNNGCEDITNYCSAKKPCPPDKVCRGNRCGPMCDANNPCPAGQKCEADKCVPDVECSDTIKCPPGKMCKDNKCVAEPPKCPVCPAGQECDASTGKCGDIAGYCDAKKPCPAGQVCKNNRCEAKGEVAACELKTIYFDFDKSEIRDDQKKALEDNVTCLKSKEGSVSVEGHCDERGTREYNIALGERRYQSVIDGLKAAGVSGDRLSGISHGKEKPACTDHGDGCWSKNRRGELKFK